MGFGGFPSLAFLDAEGNKLTQPAGRDVETFAKTLTALKAWQALAEKPKRSKAEEAQLFLAELDLGKLDLEQTKERLKANQDALTKEQSAHVANELLLLEVAGIQKAAGRDAAKAQEAFAAMATAGRAPKGPRSVTFWFGVMTHAMKQEDAKLLESALTTIKTEAAGRPGLDRMLKSFEDKLAELKGGG